MMENKKRRDGERAFGPALVWVTACAIAGCSMTSPTEILLPVDPKHNEGPPAKHVILLIGDGMGEEQIKAASLYGFGEEGGLSFEDLPYQASVHTDTAEGELTDSAASATAMATGRKVSYHAISKAFPGDGSDLETILETLKGRGWATGIVTTMYFSDATPAAFMAHAEFRSEYPLIASQIIDVTRPTLLFGGAKYITQDDARASGYTVVADKDEMLALPRRADFPVFGPFGESRMPYEIEGYEDEPHLFEMTAAAIDILAEDKEGFFLMVEGGLIDQACHSNNLVQLVGETLAFSDAASVAIEWAMAHIEDTLLIVTADHETGGLGIVKNNQEGQYPDVTWSATQHTRTPVKYFAMGVGADPGVSSMENNEIYDVMMDAVSGDY